MKRKIFFTVGVSLCVHVVKPLENVVKKKDKTRLIYIAGPLASGSVGLRSSSFICLIVSRQAIREQPEGPGERPPST